MSGETNPKNINMRSTANFRGIFTVITVIPGVIDASYCFNSLIIITNSVLIIELLQSYYRSTFYCCTNRFLLLLKIHEDKGRDRGWAQCNYIQVGALRRGRGKVTS